MTKIFNGIWKENPVFVLMLGMGYLSSRDFTQASMNWIAEGVNLVGQGIFLLAAGKLVRK